jgi:outer membrane protein assembly factor BamE
VPAPSPRLRRPLAPLAVAALLAGCGSLQTSNNFLGFITPYKLEIVQGNVLTKEQAELVRPGMTRAQVKDALGSPLLADPFHENRWDYVFAIRRQGAEPQLRRVIVTFEGERMAAIDTGGELPSERDFVASIDTGRQAKGTRVLALTDAEIAALPAPARPAASAPPPPPPARTYPPLESAP